MGSSRGLVYKMRERTLESMQIIKSRKGFIKAVPQPKRQQSSPPMDLNGYQSARTMLDLFHEAGLAIVVGVNAGVKLGQQATARLAGGAGGTSGTCASTGALALITRGG